MKRFTLLVASMAFFATAGQLQQKQPAMKKTELSCKLSTPELQQRKASVIAELKSFLMARQELRNGYRYRFPSDDAMIDRLATFIKTERLCCDFFTFKMELRNDKFLELELTGPPGAREFIEKEIGF